MKIKVEPFMTKRGNRVGKAAIEFTSNDGPLAGFHLIGFTICENSDNELYVMFPASTMKDKKTGKISPFFLLKPSNDEQLDELEDKIISIYEDMTKAAIRNELTITEK